MAQTLSENPHLGPYEQAQARELESLGGAAFLSSLITVPTTLLSIATRQLEVTLLSLAGLLDSLVLTTRCQAALSHLRGPLPLLPSSRIPHP